MSLGMSYEVSKRHVFPGERALLSCVCGSGYELSAKRLSAMPACVPVAMLPPVLVMDFNLLQVLGPNLTFLL